MRPLEVVVLDEQPHPPLAVLVIGEHRAREQLLPQRLPEPLDLPAGLRVLRPALQVLDAVTLQLRFELGAAAPGRVLTALIGEDLSWRPVVGDPARQRLEHQHASLVMRHRHTHQIARVIVQERRDIQPLVPTQQEREDVRLPQLVRLRALEVAHRMLSSDSPLRDLRLHTFGLQHTPHGRLGSADAQEPSHQIADAAAAGLRRTPLRCHDRFSLRSRTTLASRGNGPRLRLERYRTTASIHLHPLDRRRVRHAQLLRHREGRQFLLHYRLRQSHLHLQRPRSSLVMARRSHVPRFARLLFAFHLSTPLLFLQQQTTDRC
jgi:hypothetical protein